MNSELLHLRRRVFLGLMLSLGLVAVLPQVAHAAAGAFSPLTFQPNAFQSSKNPPRTPRPR